jgi:hypothetical protein
MPVNKLVCAPHSLINAILNHNLTVSSFSKVSHNCGTMNSTLCPDNSIHCLLRALLNDNSTIVLLEQVLKAQQKFNWDPLNFAFTAAIGVLALIVACITVFQSLLAAGPGRRKASRTSIGAFAVQTKCQGLGPGEAAGLK